MRTGAWRTGAPAAAFAVVLCLSVWALDRFAHHEFSVHLRNQAARALALAASAGTPYQWYFKNPDELVAGRPFDAAKFEFADSGLRLRDVGRPFEIGLALPRSIDLHTFPHFKIVFDADVAGEFRIVVREKLHSAELMSSAIAFAGQHHDAVTDLGALEWKTTGARADVKPAPRAAAMLHLRFFPGRQGTIFLRVASLQRAPGYVPLALDGTPRIVDAGHAASDSDGLEIYRLPFAAQTQKVDIDAIASNYHSAKPPLILLPERGRVEQQIALRNAVYSALPAAILIPESQYEQTVAEARALAADGNATVPSSTQWRLVALFGAILMLARIRSPKNPRWRALIEIVLTLAVPAWLIIGGNYDGTLHTPQTVLIGFTVIYAISLSLPRVWHWNGNLQAWLYSGLVVVLALLICLVLYRSGGHLTVAPGVRQIARYVGWALLQQYLMCAVCTGRWQVITGSTLVSVYLGAIGFALLHTPNAALMIATFIGGLCWCAIYLRYRALLPLAVSHAASALLLSTLLPTEILHSAEVSVRFFQ